MELESGVAETNHGANFSIS